MLNKVILIGRLTKDPELRYTPAGAAVTQFTLAVDRPFVGENKEREADFIPIVTWRQLAEACANHLTKGRLCAVEGRVQVRFYENGEGKRVYVTEVIADNVRFLERSERQGSGNGEGSSQNAAGASTGGQSGNRGAGKSSQSNDPFADDGRPIDISDDDLPF